MRPTDAVYVSARAWPLYQPPAWPPLAKTSSLRMSSEQAEEYARPERCMLVSLDRQQCELRRPERKDRTLRASPKTYALCLL